MIKLLINESKLLLKGKGIFINTDLTKIQIELDYKLRQEIKRLFSNLSEEDRTISHYILNVEQFSNMIKQTKLILNTRKFSN